MRQSVSTTQKGSEAETMAASFLARQGYQVLCRNYRYGKSEIDLIAQKGSFIVFVEVKYRTNTSFGHPEQVISYQQVNRIATAAQAWMESQKIDAPVRYDVISITSSAGMPIIRHFEDAIC